MLAEPALWVLLLAWIYWNRDKTAGRFISYTVFTSLCFGNGLKEIFRMPRPIGEPGIRTIYAETATGYSFPSGHSQMMATVGSAIPLWYRKNSLWYFFIPLMFLVAFSRMCLQGCCWVWVSAGSVPGSGIGRWGTPACLPPPSG